MAKEFDYREYLAEGWLFKDRGISVDKVKDRLMKIYKSKYGDNDTIKGHVAVEFDDEDGNPSGEYVYIQPDSIEYHADRQAAGVPIDKWDDEIVNAVWKNLKKKKYFPVGVEENLNEVEKDKYSMDVDECDAGLMNEADRAIALFHKKMNS